MVKMGVGQKDSVDTVGRYGKRVPVSFYEVAFLVKAAVYKKADAISPPSRGFRRTGFKQVPGTGYVLSGTEKL
jgi:hypothetical protein